MSISQEIIDKRKNLKVLLRELSESQTLLQNPTERSSVYRKLEQIYATNDTCKFRHFYSDIFEVLTQIEQSELDSSIEILGQNLSQIHSGYKPQNFDNTGNLIDISESINKLYDHVNLDIARINFSKKMDRELLKEDSIENVKTKINEFESNLSEINCANTEIQKELKLSKREHVTILGIFASIVLAFTTGIIFSSSVLENLHLSSVFRISIVVTILGIVLINLVFGLFYYIEKIVRTNDSPRLKPLLISNISFFALLLAIILLRVFGAI